MEKADPDRCSGITALLEELVRNAGSKSELLHRPMSSPHDFCIMFTAVDLEVQYLIGRSLFVQQRTIMVGVADWAMHLLSVIIFMCRDDWSDAARPILTALLRPFLLNVPSS